MPAQEKEEVKGATLGLSLLKIYVHFGLEEAAAGSVIADTLETLRDKIIAKFSGETNKFPPPHKLIVQTKDADNNLRPLKNDAELVLDGVVKLDEGRYRVYVEAPKEEIAAISAGMRRMFIASPDRSVDNLINSLSTSKDCGKDIYFGESPTLPGAMGLENTAATTPIAFPDPFAPKEREDDGQPRLVELLDQLCQTTVEPIDTHSHSQYGSAFDVDVVLNLRNRPRVFANVAAVIEMKTDISNLPLMNQAVGQLRDRITRLREEQPLRNLFWGVATDLKRVMFLRALIGSRELEFETTDPFSLYEETVEEGKLVKKEAPGTEYLRCLLQFSPEQFGMKELDPPKLAAESKDITDLSVICHRRNTRFVIYTARMSGRVGILKVPVRHSADKTEGLFQQACGKIDNEYINIKQILSIFPKRADVQVAKVPLADQVNGKAVEALFFSPMLIPLKNIPSRNSQQIRVAIASVAKQILDLHAKHGKVHGELSVGNIVVAIDDSKVQYALPIDWPTCNSKGQLVVREHVTLTPVFCSRSILKVVLSNNQAYLCENDDAEALFNVLLWKLTDGSAPLFLPKGKTEIQDLLRRKISFFGEPHIRHQKWFVRVQLSYLRPAYDALCGGNAKLCLQELSKLK